MYNVPGRLAWVGGPKAPNMYVFASQQLDYDRNDVAQQKRIVADAFAGVGWQVPRMLSRLADAPEFYLDSISRTALDHYTTGRVALIGDAAYGNTLGGFGTGLALVGAYVLAGELAAAGGDHHLAFARYNHQMHQYARCTSTPRSPVKEAPGRSWPHRHQPGSDCGTGPSGSRCHCD